MYELMHKLDKELSSADKAKKKHLLEARDHLKRFDAKLTTLDGLNEKNTKHTIKELEDEAEVAAKVHLEQLRQEATNFLSNKRLNLKEEHEQLQRNVELEAKEKSERALRDRLL